MLLSLIIACTGGAVSSWKPVGAPNTLVEVINATTVRVITTWINVAGSDSVRVQVGFGTQVTQNKQYVFSALRTKDTTNFVAVAGESSSGFSTVTAVKVGRTLTPVTVNWGPVTIPIVNWPAVTGVTVTTDTI